MKRKFNVGMADDKESVRTSNSRNNAPENIERKK